MFFFFLNNLTEHLLWNSSFISFQKTVRMMLLLEGWVFMQKMCIIDHLTAYSSQSSQKIDTRHLCWNTKVMRPGVDRLSPGTEFSCVIFSCIWPEKHGGCTEPQFAAKLLYLCLCAWHILLHLGPDLSSYSVKVTIHPVSYGTVQYFKDLSPKSHFFYWDALTSPILKHLSHIVQYFHLWSPQVQKYPEFCNYLY